MGAGCKKVVLGSCFSCCLLLSLVLCAVAVAFWLTFPFVLNSQVDQKVTVQEGHATYEQLQNLTLPLWKSFYFFNLTNPAEFEAGGKPNLEEIGPYSYREYRTKNITGFSKDNQHLTYTQEKVFYFDPEATGENLSDSDIICTVNIPFIAAADQVVNDTVQRDLLKLLIDAILHPKPHLYVCQNATALAWNYTDTLIDALHAAKKYPRTYVNIQVNASVNDTQPSVIHTGVGNISRIGEYIQWDGHNEILKIWEPGSQCDKIRGTEGLFFRPNLKEGENLTAFVDDVARSFDLEYEGKVNHLGLEAFRYVLANHTFYNKDSYPDNACWGPKETIPNGLIYLGPTQYPVIPVYGSNPHFFNGDPSLFDCIEGLDPENASDLITKIDVEPITGANVQLEKNLQLNVRIHRYDDMTYLKDIKCVQHNYGSYYYPVLWLSEHAELTPGFKQYLEGKGLQEVELFNKILIPLLFAVLLALAVVALVVSLCTCCCFIHVSRKSLEEERQPLLRINRNE